MLLALTVNLLSCQTDKKLELSPFQQHQQEQNEFMLSDDSPLPPTDKVNFISLNYYTYDSSYCVAAEYQEIANGRTQKFKTNTERAPIYVHKANLRFTLNDSTFILEAFMQQNNRSTELFVPFMDKTNGVNTYKSGRYIDLPIPKKNNFILDFNLAYNPYCAYNTKYSCPIPPKENKLNIGIKAGEKAYH